MMEINNDQPEICIMDKENLYRLIIGQLSYDGYTTIASSLASQVNANPPCSPSGRLRSVVEIGLQHETVRQIESEQALNFNPIQQMIIGQGIDLEFDSNVDCTAPEPWCYENVYETSHNGACNTGAFSPNGQLIATGSRDASIQILDIEKMLAKANAIGSSDNREGQGHPVIQTFYDHSKEVTCLEFHPNKPILVSGSLDCQLKFFDYSKINLKNAIKTIKDTNQIICLNFHPLGDYMITATICPLIKIYNVNTAQCFISPYSYQNHTNLITSIKYELDAKYFASSSHDGSIKLWDTTSFKCFKTFEKAHNGASVTSVTFSRNGKYMLSSGKNAVVKLWELSTQRCLIEYSEAGTTGKPEHHIQASFNHTEEYVLYTDDMSTSLYSWNSRNAFRHQSLALGHYGPINSIVHSPSSAAFLTCSDDFRACFWYTK